jgi:hypothetical protein
MKTKSELNLDIEEIFNKISNMELYYANTANLILDFLEN